jgi:23S rRNA pseudouridine2605 synthase
MTDRRRTGKNQVTLARALSKFGLASRKQAVDMINDGRVAVRGRIVRSPALWIDPARDQVTVDGRKLRREERQYLVMNKPRGYVTTRSDNLGQATVYDLLPARMKWMFPVGRLDKDTSGLLLFTNDTRFGNTVTNPEEEIPKTYVVTVNRPLQVADRRRMSAPLRLSDGTILKPATVTVEADPCTFRMTIVEGKNRQVRRVCDELGYEVMNLCRVSIGPIMLGALQEGKTRRLSEREMSDLMSKARA